MLNQMISTTKKTPLLGSLLKFMYPRDVLIFREVALQVLPPLRSLTAVFGMGTGVTSSP